MTVKQIVIIHSIFLISFTGFAQVQIKPLPKPGYEKRIREYIDNMKVVDTHEHMMPPEVLLRSNVADFSLMFFNYSHSDLISAGMPREEVNKLWGNTLTTKEKWQLVKPHWEGASNTAYNRAVLLSADSLFGVKNIDSATVEILSQKIGKVYEDPAKWYDHILRDKCKIEYIISNPWFDCSFFNQKMYRHVNTFNRFIFINSKNDLARQNNFDTHILDSKGNYLDYTKWIDNDINTLDNLVLALERAFKVGMDGNMIGVKMGLAYCRTLFFENIKKEEAEEVFNKIKNSSENSPFTFQEVKPLQDYMMHRLLDICRANHMPVQIHTGLQDGNGNNIENSKPTHLVNLFQEYPDVKFILFHGSYPYGGELSTLAKNFPNVYIDMCWLHIISPSYSERYLNEWLETVPANKIMGFGGDFLHPEGTFGHLLIAKQVISNVLIAKVRDGYFTEDEAIKVAQMILHDNAVRILNIK